MAKKHTLTRAEMKEITVRSRMATNELRLKGQYQSGIGRGLAEFGLAVNRGLPNSSNLGKAKEAEPIG